MKDYLKETEELLDPMKKIYHEMNPMKNIMDSLKPTNTYDNLYSTTYLSAIDKAQEELEYTLNVFEKFYTNMSFNSIKKQNYEKEIKAIYNQNKNDVLKANNYNPNIGNQISF